jgi:hypothetical protein
MLRHTTAIVVNAALLHPTLNRLLSRMKFLSFLLRLIAAALAVAAAMALAITAGVWFYRSPAGATLDQWGPRTYILITCGLMLVFVLLARRQKFGRMLGGLFRGRARAEKPRASAESAESADHRNASAEAGAAEARQRVPRRIAAYRERRGAVTGLRRRS